MVILEIYKALEVIVTLGVFFDLSENYTVLGKHDIIKKR